MTPASLSAWERELIRDEGCVLTAYKDSRGFLTIGVGRFIDVGGGISKDEAFYLLRNDMTRVLSECRQAFPWFEGLDEVRQRAIASMAFNLGLSKLKQFTNTLAAVARGDYAQAADGMLKSLWARQVKGRAVRLATMMRDGRDQST